MNGAGPPPWWPPIYDAILADFGWTPTPDVASAEHLRDLIGRDAWRHVGTELKHRPLVTVVGCGPSIDEADATSFPAGIVVAADGATARLRELGILPRVVVTDLDGDLDAIAWAAEQGASIVVHAHGHNQEAHHHVTEWGPFVCGTYQHAQGPSLAPLRNFGGFTDGDRAVHLCEAFGVKQVHLVGFDLDAPPGKHSGSWNPETKPAKLAWASRLLQGVADRGRTRLSGFTPLDLP